MGLVFVTIEKGLTEKNRLGELRSQLEWSGYDSS